MPSFGAFIIPGSDMLCDTVIPKSYGSQGQRSSSKEFTSRRANLTGGVRSPLEAHLDVDVTLIDIV